MIFIGVLVAGVGIVVDEVLKRLFSLRLPVLAVGLGIYLPMSASMPVVIGGLLSYVVGRVLHTRYGIVTDGHEAHASVGLQKTILLACGLVAGATLMGVVLAIPFALKRSADALRLVPNSFAGVAAILATIMTLLLCYWIYDVAVRAEKNKY